MGVFNIIPNTKELHYGNKCMFVLQSCICVNLHYIVFIYLGYVYFLAIGIMLFMN